MGGKPSLKLESPSFLQDFIPLPIFRNEPSQAEVPGILHEISVFDTGSQVHHAPVVGARPFGAAPERD